MEETLTMTNREMDRLKVIHNVIHRKLTWHQAGEHLGLSQRQIGRHLSRVRAEGNRGIIHRLRGRASNHRVEPKRLEKALRLIRTHYPDFGPTFANEKLRERHGVVISTFALRQGMMKAGLWKPGRHKHKHRAWRPRRSCVGMLVQLDGSDHDWFEGRGPRCVLLLFIDDATSRILYAEFIPVENTLNLLEMTRLYLLKHGRPVSFYVDKDSIYKINRQATVEEQLRDDQPLTQFTRAMKELDIEVIAAHSPQAKGRVERSFKTHQDRLVKELRLRGISTPQHANTFLRNVYLPKHNAHFAVEPASLVDAHRPLLKSHRLDEILSLRSERTLLHDFTLRFQNKFLQLLPEQTVRVRPQNKILVETRLDGSTHLRFKDVYLCFKTIPKRPCEPSNKDHKPPQAVVCPSKPYKPPKDHPWRRWTPKKSMAPSHVGQSTLVS
jgi:DNA-binding transcriptional ArsR family regulator